MWVYEANVYLYMTQRFNRTIIMQVCGFKPNFTWLHLSCDNANSNTFIHSLKVKEITVNILVRLLLWKHQKLSWKLLLFKGGGKAQACLQRHVSVCTITQKNLMQYLIKLGGE